MTDNLPVKPVSRNSYDAYKPSIILFWSRDDIELITIKFVGSRRITDIIQFVIAE